MCKFIIVTGGVVSGLGKGVVASSIGNILSSLDYKVSIAKCDPYINIDPGTLNPKQHGEVFVTYDGGEVDLDFGHYERFLNQPISKLNNITTGSIYQSVINKERNGKYDGITVQIFHIIEEIKSRIYFISKDLDFLIIEIGGTVGDLESSPFLEAVRQIKSEQPNNICFIHCTYIPFVKCSNEYKTKPSQHSVKFLQSAGIIPDILIPRSELTLPLEIIDKLSKYCYIQSSNIIPLEDVPSIYDIPSKLRTRVLHSLNTILNLTIFNSNELFVSKNKSESLTQILIVGKYSNVKDSYISVEQSCKIAALYLNKEITINYIDTTDSNYFLIFKELIQKYKNTVVIVPGGFGASSINNILRILKVCRINNIRTLGICLGMQLMCIEYFNCFYAINSNSTEFDINTSIPLFHLLENQVHGVKGGSLKLGTYPTKLSKDSIIFNSYNKEVIYERHRHRYEFNNYYRSYFKESDLIITGVSPDNQFVNSVELNSIKHPFYVGTQFHPEFTTSFSNPHPLFISLLSI